MYFDTPSLVRSEAEIPMLGPGFHQCFGGCAAKIDKHPIDNYSHALKFFNLCRMRSFFHNSTHKG